MAGLVPSFVSTHHPLLPAAGICHRTRTEFPIASQRPLSKSQVLPKWRTLTVIEHIGSPLQCSSCNYSGRTKCRKSARDAVGTVKFSSLQTLHSTSSRYFSLLSSFVDQNFARFGIHIHGIIVNKEKLKQVASIIFIRVVKGLLVMSVSLAISNSPSWSLTGENLLFLEAWRTVDRAYYDKTFNGQSWFRYREDALRNEPMNTREETYMAIRKMLSTLDDPFTRFLEPDKFKSLRSGTQGALTGVGLSIGYPTSLAGSSSGLVVISSSPGGPANKAGIMPGDIILAIDDTSTDEMDIYDAAERLQGTEGSTVKLNVRRGDDIKDVVLRREKVTLNPVRSRLCEIRGIGNDRSTIGYIKLSSFNQNASANAGAIG